MRRDRARARKSVAAGARKPRSSRPEAGPTLPAADPPAWPAALLSVGLFGIYAATACRTVGPGDAGELAVALSTWGVPHAPGFPLLALLGNLVTHLARQVEPAWALNLMSAACAALACGVLARAVALLTGRPWAGVGAGLALGTSRVFWEYALVIEVFSVNALMAAVLLWLLAHVLRGVRVGRPVLWPLPWAGLVMSTCLTHHLTLALLAVPVLIVLLGLTPALRAAGATTESIRRAVGSSVAAGLAGLLVVLYIPLAARHDPPLNWGNASDLSTLLRLLLRRDFGSGMLVLPNVVVGQLLTAGEAASPLGLRHYAGFLAAIPENFGWLFPVLTVVGLIWAARRDRALTWLTLLFLGLLTVFLTRVNAPIVPLFVGIVRPFYILPHLYLAFLAGLGIAWLEDLARSRHRLAPAAVLTLALGGAGFMLVRHWPDVDMRHNTFTRDYGANLIAALPPRAILFASGELTANSFHYQQVCLNRRPDVTLVEQSKMTTPWYVSELRRRRSLRLPDAMTVYDGSPGTGSRAWLDLNQDRPLAVVRFIDGGWQAAYRTRAMGFWSVVEPRSRALDFAAWSDSFGNAVRTWQVGSLAPEYAEYRWESSEGSFYPYALGTLAALRELVAVRAAGGRATLEVPALAVAERWRGRRRSDYLAYQAYFWQSRLADFRTPADSAIAGLCADRARALAESSLAVNPGNVQALQTLTTLRRSVPRYRNPVAEAAVRWRIVQQRPGDLAELEPYFALVVAIMRDPALRDPAILDRAEAVRRRYVALLELCQRIWPNPDLLRLRERWSTPLADAIAPG